MENSESDKIDYEHERYDDYLASTGFFDYL